MKQRTIKIGPRAQADMRHIGRYVAHFGMPATAEQYIIRLSDFVLHLDLAAERGIARDDIREGLRIIAFEKSANLAVLIRENSATVVRVFYRGQDWEGALFRQFARR